MKDRCGFLFVRYKRHCCTELVGWEHAACPLSGIKKRPLLGGWLNTSSVVISIGTTASVRYREVVHSWEGPLWEVPLYWNDLWPLIGCLHSMPVWLWFSGMWSPAITAYPCLASRKRSDFDVVVCVCVCVHFKIQVPCFFHWNVPKGTLNWK